MNPKQAELACEVIVLEPAILLYVVGGAVSSRTSKHANPELLPMLQKIADAVKELGTSKQSDSSSMMMPMMMMMMRRR